MASTPSNRIKFDDKVKTSGGIRKALLTPCRRIGLPKVVRTPVSSEKALKSTHSPFPSNTNTQESSNLPLDSPSTLTTTDGVINKNETKKNGVKKGNAALKKTAKKCLLQEANFDGKKNENELKENDSCSAKKVLKSNEKSETPKITAKLDEIQQLTKDISQKNDFDDNNDFRPSPLSQEPKPLPKQSQSPKNQNNSTKSKVPFKKRLSMKKSISSDSEPDIFLQEITNSQKSSESTDCRVHLEMMSVLSGIEKIKEEEKDVTEKMVNEIEKRIKEKEDKLTRLKQAEVYSKKHRVDDLKALTLTWKNGCQQALTDLLVLLKSHNNDMDMVTLLQKLNIPDNMIQYDYESDQFL